MGVLGGWEQWEAVYAERSDLFSAGGEGVLQKPLLVPGASVDWEVCGQGRDAEADCRPVVGASVDYCSIVLSIIVVRRSVLLSVMSP